MVRLALLLSLLLAAAISVDLAILSLIADGGAAPRLIAVALLTSQCGLVAMLLYVLSLRPLAQAAMLLAAVVVMSVVFQLPLPIVGRLLAVNFSAALAVMSFGYRCSAMSVEDDRIRKSASTTAWPQYSLAQLLTLVTLVSLAFGFEKLWPPQPSQVFDVPLLAAIAFAALAALATPMVLAKRRCGWRVCSVFAATFFIIGLFLSMQYPWIGMGILTLLGLHTALVVTMLLVLRVAGLRMRHDGALYCYNEKRFRILDRPQAHSQWEIPFKN